MESGFMKNISVVNYNNVSEQFNVEDRKQKNEKTLNDFGFEKIVVRTYSYDPNKKIQFLSKYLVTHGQYEMEFLDCLDVSLENESLILKSVECLDSGMVHPINISINNSELSNGRLVHLKKVLELGPTNYFKDVSKKIEAFEEHIGQEGFVGFGSIIPEIQNNSNAISFTNGEATFFLKLTETSKGQQSFCISNAEHWSSQEMTTSSYFGVVLGEESTVQEMVNATFDILNKSETDLDLELIESGYCWSLTS